MTLENAFLQAIRDEPEDDATRLIFADWLEDGDRPERTEFVRLQIRLACLQNGLSLFRRRNHSDGA